MLRHVKNPGVFSLVCIMPLLLLFISCRNDAGIDKTEVEKAKNIIINSTSVSSSRIYESGNISRNAWAFSVLYQHAEKYGCKDFIDVFYKSKHQEGRIYALAGLFRLDKKNYQYLKKQMLPGKVHIQWYCESSERDLNTLFEKDIPSESFFKQLIILPVPKYEITQ